MDLTSVGHNRSDFPSVTVDLTSVGHNRSDFRQLRVKHISKRVPHPRDSTNAMRVITLRRDNINPPSYLPERRPIPLRITQRLWWALHGENCSSHELRRGSTDHWRNNRSSICHRDSLHQCTSASEMVRVQIQARGRLFPSR